MGRWIQVRVEVVLNVLADDDREAVARAVEAVEEITYHSDYATVERLDRALTEVEAKGPPKG